MVRLYLVRHSKAVESHPLGDSQRPLSPEGRRRAAVLAGLWSARGATVDLALASPLIRAQETRAALAPVWRGAREETSAAFAPSGDTPRALEAVQGWVAAGYHDIAIVTHNPFVTHFAAALLEAGATAGFEFHAPTVLALEWDGEPTLGTGRALWSLTP